MIQDAKATLPPPPEARPTFRQLLAPMPVEEFFSRYWQHEVLHVVRHGTTDESIISIRELGGYLSSHTQHSGFLRVVKDGVDRVPREWTARSRGPDGPIPTADPARLLSFLADGATIVVNQAGRTFPGLIRLCAALEAELHYAVQANVYITPPGQSGLLPHTDGHDVLVLQVHGTKLWRLYGAAGGESAGGGGLVDPVTLGGRSIREIELRTGDLLYVPRHQIHDARTGRDSSVHVTLGFPVPSWRDALRHLIGRDLDQPIPADVWPDDGRMREQLARRLMEALQDDKEPTVTHLGAGRPQAVMDLGSWFEDAMQAERLSLASRVRRRTGTRAHVELRDGGIAVSVGADVRPFLAPLDGLVRALLQEAPVRVADVQGRWPAAVTLDIAQTLLRMGALEVDTF